MSLRLATVVNGRTFMGDPETDVRVRMQTGEELDLPATTDAMADAIVGQDPFLLRDTPLSEIVAFLNLVGRNWKSKEYSRRRIYIRYLQRFLGYSEAMAELEANWIALILCSHYRMYDTIATELGNRCIMDQWIPSEEAQVRAFPRGRCVHVLPGNVPLSGVASTVRALITKNVCVVKPASEDPISPIMLAMSFVDANPVHPVARAISVAFWESSRPPEAAQKILQSAHVACVWGGAEAVKWSTRAFPPETEVLRFGPRRSLAVIGRHANYEQAARGVAHNVCMYDQRACFSVRQVFVEGPVEPFLEELRKALDLYRTILPKGTHDFDQQAHWSLSTLEAELNESLIEAGEAQSWSIVVCRPEDALAHPLGRAVYVHPIERLQQVADYVTPDVQTVAVAPYDIGFGLRDVLAHAGACRIVDIGLTNVFRVGGTHDAMYPSQRLVRLVSFERPSQEHPKGVPLPIDQTKFLEEDRFLEFIP
jgi:long-chain-fatty-acyl-CoA reductase